MVFVSFQNQKVQCITSINNSIVLYCIVLYMDIRILYVKSMMKNLTTWECLRWITIDLLRICNLNIYIVYDTHRVKLTINSYFQTIRMHQIYVNSTFSVYFALLAILLGENNIDCNGKKSQKTTANKINNIFQPQLR